MNKRIAAYVVIEGERRVLRSCTYLDTAMKFIDRIYSPKETIRINFLDSRQDKYYVGYSIDEFKEYWRDYERENNSDPIRGK